MAAKNVYVTVPEKLVREINYNDKKTGEPRSFFSVRVPSGVSVGGVNLAGGEFTNRFANHPAKYLGEDYTDIPLLADRLVWVDVPVRDGAGNVVLDEGGKWVTETHKVQPSDLKAAFDKSRAEYQKKEADRADAGADAPSPEAQGGSWDDVPSTVLSDEDIDF